MVAHLPPLGLRVVGAEGAGRTRQRTIGVALGEPILAVLARHALLDQRPAPDRPHVAGRLRPGDLVGGDADPLLDEPVGRHPLLVTDADQAPHLAADRFQLVLAGALAFRGAPLGAPQDVGGDGHEAVARGVDPFHHMGDEIAPADAIDGKAQLGVQPVEVLVDRPRLRAGIGEHGGVGHAIKRALVGHQRHHAGLHAGTE